MSSSNQLQQLKTVEQEDAPNLPEYEVQSCLNLPTENESSHFEVLAYDLHENDIVHTIDEHQNGPSPNLDPFEIPFNSDSDDVTLDPSDLNELMNFLGEPDPTLEPNENNITLPEALPNENNILSLLEHTTHQYEAFQTYEGNPYDSELNSTKESDSENESDTSYATFRHILLVEVHLSDADEESNIDDTSSNTTSMSSTSGSDADEESNIDDTTSMTSTSDNRRLISSIEDQNENGVLHNAAKSQNATEISSDEDNHRVQDQLKSPAPAIPEVATPNPVIPDNQNENDIPHDIAQLHIFHNDREIISLISDDEDDPRIQDENDILHHAAQSHNLENDTEIISLISDDEDDPRIQDVNNIRHNAAQSNDIEVINLVTNDEDTAPFTRDSIELDQPTFAEILKRRYRSDTWLHVTELARARQPLPPRKSVPKKCILDCCNGNHQNKQQHKNRNSSATRVSRNFPRRKSTATISDRRGSNANKENSSSSSSKNRETNQEARAAKVLLRRYTEANATRRMLRQKSIAINDERNVGEEQRKRNWSQKRKRSASATRKPNTQDNDFNSFGTSKRPRRKSIATYCHTCCLDD